MLLVLQGAVIVAYHVSLVSEASNMTASNDIVDARAALASTAGMLEIRRSSSNGTPGGVFASL